MFCCFFLFLPPAQGPCRGIEFLSTSLGNASGRCEGECIRWTGTNSWLPTCDSLRTARTAGSSSGKSGSNTVVWSSCPFGFRGPTCRPRSWICYPALYQVHRRDFPWPSGLAGYIYAADWSLLQRGRRWCVSWMLAAHWKGVGMGQCCSLVSTDFTSGGEGVEVTQAVWRKTPDVKWSFEITLRKTVAWKTRENAWEQKRHAEVWGVGWYMWGSRQSREKNLVMSQRSMEWER